MSHQPFETWIFSDDSLDEAQKHQLDEHLENCQPCSTLADAAIMSTNLLTSSESPAPLPGFTQRWHNRLAMHRQYQKSRRTWLLALAGVILANIILLSLVFFDLTTINWPYELGLIVVKISLIATHSSHYWRAITNLAHAFPVIIPTFFVLVAALIAVGVFLTITWIRSMKKIIKTK